MFRREHWAMPIGRNFVYVEKILENLVFPLICVNTSAQRPKYAIAWSSAPDPAGKRIVLPRFRSSYLGIELGKRKRDEAL